MRFNAFFSTICKIIIYSLVKSLGKLLYTFPFKIYESVYTFDFTEKNSIGLTESNRSYKILIFKSIHIKSSYLRYS